MKILVTTLGGIEKYELFNILNNLPNIEVFAADAASNVITSTYGDKFIEVPYANNKEYIPFIKDIVSKYKIDAILPIDTAESIKLNQSEIDIPIMSAAKDPRLRFKTHISEVLEDTYEEASDYRGIKKAVNKYFKLGYDSVVVKPDDGHGSKGLRIITKKDRNIYTHPYFITLESIEDLIHVIDPEPLIIQPFYDGQNYNVDCFYSKEIDHLYIVPQKVVGDRWGQVKGSEIITEDDPEYVDILWWAHNLKYNFDLNYNFNFELSFDPITDKLGFVELNPRISAVFPQTHYTNRSLVSITLAELNKDKELLNQHKDRKLEKVELQSAFSTIKLVN